MSGKTRRSILLAAAASLLVASPIAAVWWALTPEPGVTLENFRRLHDGMTLEEIETIMGKPSDRCEIPMNGSSTHIWVGDEGTVSITQGFVTGTFQKQGETVRQLASAPRSFRIRHWLGF
jgi:hypothetical protein